MAGNASVAWQQDGVCVCTSVCLHVCMYSVWKIGESWKLREFSDLKNSHLAIFTSYLLVLYPLVFPKCKRYFGVMGVV